MPYEGFFCGPINVTNSSSHSNFLNLNSSIIRLYSPKQVVRSELKSKLELHLECLIIFFIYSPKWIYLIIVFFTFFILNERFNSIAFQRVTPSAFFPPAWLFFFFLGHFYFLIHLVDF